MSGAFGYRFCPISVFPLPSLPWQLAQWSAKWVRASLRTSAAGANGFLASRSDAGIESFRAVFATYASIAEGLSRALNPRRIVTHPNAAAPTMPATMIDRRTMRFLMRLPLLGACAHLEWDVDLTHRLVDSTWLRRSFEAVREQIGLQRK